MRDKLRCRCGDSLHELLKAYFTELHWDFDSEDSAEIKISKVTDINNELNERDTHNYPFQSQ